MERENILRDKSFAFAVRIVRLVQYLQNERREFVLSRQLLKAGTAIGALISEARFGQSDADFLSKISIALKEANETEYWLRLLKAADYLTDIQFQDIYHDCDELLAMLIATTKTVKNKLNR